MSFPSGAATTFAHEISSFSSRAPDTQRRQDESVVVLAETVWFPDRGKNLVASTNFAAVVSWFVRFRCSHLDFLCPVSGDRLFWSKDSLCIPKRPRASGGFRRLLTLEKCPPRLARVSVESIALLHIGMSKRFLSVSRFVMAVRDWQGELQSAAILARDHCSARAWRPEHWRTQRVVGCKGNGERWTHAVIHQGLECV